MARKFTKYPTGYIKANSFRKKMTEDYPKVIAMLRGWIREVSRCETLEELQHTEAYRSRGWDRDARMQDTTLDFTEKLDMIIDSLYNEINTFTQFQTEKLDELSREEQAISDIEQYLTGAGISFVTQEDGIHVYPDDLGRASLVNFIDNLIAALGGQYFGTGRGGSWTAWHVLINGIDFEIGPIDGVILSYKGDEDCWLIKP